MTSSDGSSPDQSFEGFYTSQDDLRSTHCVFPKVGKESSEAFYQWLQNLGVGLPNPNGGAAQRPKLQPLVWNKIEGVAEPSNQSLKPPKSDRMYRWENDQEVAAHVELVTRSLEGRGSGRWYQTTSDKVFIYHDFSKRSCNNISCPDTQERAGGRVRSSPAVTIEPLLDWGTVEPASDVLVASGRVYPFRRNGARMMDPLWTQAVRKLVPQQLSTYCLDCVEELLVRQADVRLINCPKDAPIDQSQGNGHYHYAIQPIRRPLFDGDLYDLRKTDDLVDDVNFEGQASSIDGSLYLDGVVDEDSRAERCDCVYHGIYPKDKTRKASWTSEYNLISVGDTKPSELSYTQRYSRSFTPPPDSSSLYNVHSLPPPRRVWLNSPPPTPDTRKTRFYVHHDSKSTQHEGYEKLGSKALLPGSYPDFGTGSRRFGRDIDTNAVRGFFTNHRIRREDMAKAKDDDIRNFFTVINPQGPSTPQRVVKTKDLDDILAHLSDVPPDISENENDSELSEAEYTSTKNKGKASTNKNIPSPQSKHAGKGHPSKAPIHRKRDAGTDTPPFGISKEAFEAHIQHVPSKTDLICSCQKPARTNDVQITQCMNKECIVRWYHKDCLEKMGKFKAKHGTFLCQQCQNEKYYGDLSRANGWSMKKLVENEIGMPFTGQEVAGTFGNTGEFHATANPYGLAKPDAISMLSASAEPFTPTSAEALSRLAVGSEPSLGLTTSRPYFVNEAYTRGYEHARIADEDYEHVQVYGFYPERWDDDGDDGDDEDDGEEGGDDEGSHDEDEDMMEIS